ncbi:hypothetical protein F5888DRAFT_1886945 [Russula emetica]|nr:hypothetical protein F5888DRAFT_1886945 [Russula emetica]
MIYPAIGPPSSPSRPGPFVQIDCRLEGSSTEKCAHRETLKWSTITGWSWVTIDMLPDVALLEIFDCYVNQAREEEEEEGDPFKIQAWHTLVHVCRKWRIIALGSPLRLDLRLFCTDTTPVKETLAVWPPLPIIIGHYNRSTAQMDNIIVALEHIDRVCQINLVGITNSQLEEVLVAMQQPFPALTELRISWAYGQKDETRPVVPESLLGGSAPRLQHLELHGVRFPGLPKLVLSATDLVSLYISNIPHSGYFSPEAIVRCLSTLTRLERLSLVFKSPLSRPIRESRRLHPLTRSALPALTYFRFEGVSEYLEDLVARIDAPLLDSFIIWFFHQLIFDTPQLAQFVARTPNILPPVEVCISFSDYGVAVTSPPTFQVPIKFTLGINCRQPDWQLSCLTQVCSSSFPEAFIPTVEHLYINGWEPRWQDDIEDSQWLEALHPFTAVKCLYLSQAFASCIAPALQELAGEVLPSLQNLFLEDLHTSGHADEAIGKFVAARRLAGHPIVFSNWDR